MAMNQKRNAALKLTAGILLASLSLTACGTQNAVGRIGGAPLAETLTAAAGSVSFEENAAEQKKSYTETKSNMSDGYYGGGECHTGITVTVTYQIGGKEIEVYYNSTSEFVDAQGNVDLESAYTGHETYEYTYTLSKPLQSIDRVDKEHVIFYVPAGTTVEVSSYRETTYDVSEMQLWLCTLDGLTSDTQRKTECLNDKTSLDDTRLKEHFVPGSVPKEPEKKLTIKKNQMCKVYGYDGFCPYRSFGGITFCAK